MRCRKVRSYLSAYCNEELTGGRKLAVSEHLATCSSCRKEEAIYRSVSLAGRQVKSLRVSDDFNTKLLNRIAQERFAETRTKAYLPKNAPLAVWSKLVPAVVTACLVLAVGLYSLDSFDNSNGGMPMADTGERPDYMTVQPINNPNMTHPMDKDWSLTDQMARTERINSITNRIGSRAGFPSQANQLASTTTRMQPAPYVIQYIRIRPVMRIYRTIDTSAGKEDSKTY